MTKLFARDIAAYSNAELDRYLEESRREVEVEDPENLPEDFIQRLKDRAYRETEMVHSRPVDLGQVAARLLQVSTDKESPPRSSFPPTRPPVYEEQDRDYHQLWETGSASTQPLDEEKEYRESLQRETEAYHELVKDGGRPSHTLSLLEGIVKNPGEYREILSFWQSRGKPEDWEVFTTQLCRWKDFRKFQRFVRERNVHDKRKIRISAHCLGQYRRWEDFVGRQQPMTQEEGRFPIYVKVVKDRLTKHGLTRIFRLDEDPARQDRLTTWIEYLGYEYWWYDQFARSKYQQQRHDKAWKKLVDAKVLRPFETEEFICSIESGFLEQNEEDRAKEAVESSKSAVMLARKAISDPRRINRSPKESQQRLLEAQSKLDAAVKEYDSIKTRNDLISEFTEQTKNYRIAKENADHHSILLRWMLQQLPLIELELKQSDTAGNGSDGGVHSRLKLDRADEPSERQRPTDQSNDDGENTTTSDRRTRIASTFQGSERRKRHGHDAADDERPSKRSRRNGQNWVFSDRKTSESAHITAATGGSHGSKTASVRTVRGERELTRLADKGGRGVKAGNFSSSGTSLRRSKKKATLDIPRPSMATKHLRRSARIAERVQ